MAEENAALRELREDMKSMKAELRKVQQKQSARRRGSTSMLSRRLSTQIDELTRSAQVDVPALRQEMARLALDKNSLELELEVLRKGADLAKREFAVDASLRTELEASLSTIRNAIEDVAGVPAHARKTLEESLARLAKRQQEVCMDDLLSSDADLMSLTSREDKAEDKDRWTLHLISHLEQRLESLEDGKHVRIGPSSTPMPTTRPKMMPRRPTGLDSSSDKGRGAKNPRRSSGQQASPPRRRVVDSIVFSKSNPRSQASHKQASLLHTPLKKKTSGFSAKGIRKQFKLLSDQPRTESVQITAPAQQSSGDSKMVTDSIVMNKKKLEELRKAKATTAGSQEDVEHEDTDKLLQLGSRDSFEAPPILRDPSLSSGKEAENSSFDVIEPQEKKIDETDGI